MIIERGTITWSPPRGSHSNSCFSKLWMMTRLQLIIPSSVINNTRQLSIIPSHQLSIIPSHQLLLIPSHQLSIIPSHQLSIIPSHQLSMIPSHQLSIIPSHKLLLIPSHQLSIIPSHQLSMILSHQLSIIAPATERSSNEPAAPGSFKRVESSMARSLPVENSLPHFLWCQLSTTASYEQWRQRW